jgi:hypothetical protein
MPPRPDAPPPSPIERLIAHLTRHGHRYGLAVVTLIVALTYRGVFRGELGGDDLGFHLAETSRLADCLAARDFDLWNPSANAGFASGYYYQLIPQLVPAALTAISGGHLLFWFQLCVWLPLVLAPLAAYRALRVLGSSPWAGVAGGLAISMCLSNSRWGFGADGTFSVGLYTQTWAFAAFPLALAYGVRFLERGTHLGRAVGWSIFVGLCHPIAGVALGLGLAFGVLVRVIGTLVPWPPQTRLTHWLPWLDEAPATPLPRVWVLLARLTLLGVLLVVGALPGWITVLVDYDGFGGFPRRVADEVGPGFGGLWAWLSSGNILDAARPSVVTALLPIALLGARGRMLPWLWGAAIPYVLLLGLGPHLVTADDLLPGVRFLGPLQIVLALAASAGTFTLGAALWRRAARAREPLWGQTVLAAIGAALVVLVVATGVRLQSGRVHVGADLAWVHRDEVITIARALAAEGKPGRKQGRNGTENQWANLMPYTYGRTPALLQMGGAGLQSSPNYVFLWEANQVSGADAIKGNMLRTAWIFDAPYVMFARASASAIPDGETVVETPALAVRRLPSPGLVSPAVIVGTLPPGRFAARAAAIDWLRSGALQRDELRQYAGGPPLPATPPDVDPRAVARTRRVTRQASPGDAPDIVAEVEADQPTTFVIRESWHPRWKVFIDGAPASVRRVTPDFMAVDVPAGAHTISARFDRPWWAWGAWLLIPLTIAIGWLVSRRAARRAVASAATMEVS